ncbi:MAG: hypothetical protein JNK35_05605 [Phycisphaerae bacterium]|nr:hypothetical protein [Phycisphaerae bacterium]
MDKARTKAWIRRSQIIGGVLLLAAAGLAVANIPGLGGAAPLPEPKPVTPPKIAIGAVAVHVEPDSLAARLNALSMPMASEKPPAPPPDKPKDEPPPEPPAIAKIVWEYIGGIIAPSARRAIVSIDGEQKMLREGETEGDTRLQAVTSDYIIISKDGEESRIDRKALKERFAVASSGPSVTISPSVAAAARLAAANASGMTPGSALGAGGSASGKALPISGAANPKDAAAKAQAEKAKSERFADPAVREKLRAIYAEAMRSNGGEPPDPATLAKYGIEGFEPSEDELNRIREEHGTGGG